MNTVQSICDEVGRDVIAASVGVSKQSVSNAIAEGLFPASWFVAIKSHCQLRGVECNMALFKFKRNEAKQRGDLSASLARLVDPSKADAP